MNNRRHWIMGGVALLVGAALVTVTWLAGTRDRPRGNKQNDRPRNRATTIDERALSPEKGEALYRRYCVTCHGENGRGKGSASSHLSKPPLNFHGDTAARFTSQELFRRISHGNVKTGMPAWESQLSRRQRWEIVTFLESEFIDSAPDSPTLR